MILDKKILIVGLGLIGGSYARDLKSHNIDVMGIDNNPETIAYAISEGIIDNHNLSEQEIIQRSDIIIISIYPNDISSWILEHQEYFKDDVIITDTAGAKTKVVSDVRKILIKGEFIATHPMAGKELSGIKYSQSGLFENANFIITPTEENTLSAIELMKELALLLNFSNVEVLSVSEHDRLVGFLSHLTHVIAVSLMNTEDPTHLIRFTGDSFRDLTRIAKINEELWSQLFFLNKDVLINEIDKFMIQLDNFKTILTDEDEQEMKELLTFSKNARQKFDK